ncbi:hypothetical protein [Nocardia terpenica]|uniref:Uncharacterized protein n=1 Tax=Nocardia terpenica TaxID=455432 RepID=A0A291RH91_9NOCA|nr:hypothetical protein [Nocardia terpenica]ATL66953.1 hypothetical protein CRH09_12810 [Nocardia terpenica]
MRERLRAAVFAAAAVVLAIVIVALGWAYPPRAAVISTDRLGPDSGEPVADYLARARESLRGSDTGEHWALVSFGAGAVPGAIPEYAGGLRISQVLYHVPIDRVFTPVVAIPVPAGDAVAVASARWAASALAQPDSADERSGRVAAVAAARLHAGCACVAALVVRGRLGELRDLAAHTGIRAVQALPADAPDGAFAVTPLLPEQVGVAAPGPDDGPVPDR